MHTDTNRPLGLAAPHAAHTQSPFALTAAEQGIAQLQKEGFTSFAEVCTGATLAAVREAYQAIIDRRIDCGSDDRLLGERTRQVMFPSKYVPVFADNPALRLARGLVAKLLAVEMEQVQLHFDMLICKPPGQTTPTPWHQDASYSGQPFTEPGTALKGKTVQVWLALDDVDQDTGCMHFIPHFGLDRVLAHHVASGQATDEHRLLAVAEAVPEDSAVACPLPAGSCTMHLEGTLHATTGNHSAERWRRAWIFNLSVNGQGYL